MPFMRPKKSESPKTHTLRVRRTTNRAILIDDCQSKPLVAVHSNYEIEA
jgi:hypothetical protein